LQRVIEKILGRDISIFNNQFGIVGRRNTKARHLTWKLMEFDKGRKKELHMVFIDLEKVYDIGT